jgi:hypothetical protein
MPKSIPLLFKPEMMRACLSGTKTMTRRIVKTETLSVVLRTGKRYPCHVNREGSVMIGVDGSPVFLSPGEFEFVCPFASGKTTRVNGTWVIEPDGDEIWGKETWRPQFEPCTCRDASDCCCGEDVDVTYALDGSTVRVFDGKIGDEWEFPKAAARSNVSPLIMPRWASRFVRPVKRVRLERLSAITPKDIEREGVIERRSYDPMGGERYVSAVTGLQYTSLAELWNDSWDEINGKKAPSKSDPLVWVVEWGNA